MINKIAFTAQIPVQKITKAVANIAEEYPEIAKASNKLSANMENKAELYFSPFTPINNIIEEIIETKPATEINREPLINFFG